MADAHPPIPPEPSRLERARAALAAAEAAAAALPSSPEPRGGDRASDDTRPSTRVGRRRSRARRDGAGVGESAASHGVGHLGAARPESATEEDDADPWPTTTRTPRRRRSAHEADPAFSRGGGAAVGEVDEDEETARARQIVLRQLAMAPRSRAQLEKKLADKEVAPDTAAAVLDRFAEVGLVDDAAFAEVLVRSQQESRGLARRGLAHELRKKGVDPDIAADALGSLDTDSERARAEELVAARLRRLHGLPKDVQMRRLAGFLARKGYPGDMAFSVIREALHNAEEHSRD